jgi:CBS domain-containing protein
MARSVRDTMTASPRSVGTEATAVDAARLMRDDDIGSLPIVEKGRLVGMLTDRDIAIRVVAEGIDPGSVSVAEIASSDAVSVSPDQELEEALRLMAHHQVRRLPVVEDDQLVGMLAQADVAHEEDREKVGETVEAISDPSEAERRV